MEICRRDGERIGIGSVPGRKQQALYLVHGYRIEPVAYFKDAKDAQLVSDFLMDMLEKLNVKIVEPK